MEYLQANFNIVIATSILISHILFLFVGILLLLEKRFRTLVYDFVNKYVLQLLFLTSLSALLGSLTYSNIIGFPPCELCWIQRIFMYPQVFLSFLAMLWKDKNIVSYILPLSVIGGLVALYHSLTNYGIGEGAIGCTSALGECGRLYVYAYGYITIPLMSFTIFAYLGVISLIYLQSKKTQYVRQD